MFAFKNGFKKFFRGTATPSRNHKPICVIISGGFFLPLGFPLELDKISQQYVLIISTKGIWWKLPTAIFLMQLVKFNVVGIWE